MYGACLDRHVAQRGGLPRQPEVDLGRALEAQGFFDEGSDQAAVVAQPILYVGSISEHPQRSAEELGDGFLASAEEEGCGSDDLEKRRDGSIGIGRRGQPGQDVFPCSATPFGDVATEEVVEVLQRVAADGCLVEGPDPGIGRVAGTEVVAQLRAILLGYAQEIGDGQCREGSAVLAEELAMAVADELVELSIGERPDVVLVLLEAPRRQQAAEKRPCLLVLWRIHDHHVLEDGELVAVFFDEVADVVAVGCERQGREGPTDGVDGGERVDVLERRHHLCVTRDGDDSLVWLLIDGAVAT